MSSDICKKRRKREKIFSRSIEARKIFCKMSAILVFSPRKTSASHLQAACVLPEHDIS
jgi:hypothetical protein